MTFKNFTLKISSLLWVSLLGAAEVEEKEDEGAKGAISGASSARLSSGGESSYSPSLPSGSNRNRSEEEDKDTTAVLGEPDDPTGDNKTVDASTQQ